MSIQDWNDPRGVEVNLYGDHWVPAEVVRVLPSGSAILLYHENGVWVATPDDNTVRHPPAKSVMPNEVFVAPVVGAGRNKHYICHPTNQSGESYTRTASLGEGIAQGSLFHVMSVLGDRRQFGVEHYVVYKLPEPQS